MSDWNMSDGVDKVVYLLKSKWLKAVISSVSGHYTFMALPTEYVNKFPLLYCHNKHIGSLSDSMLFVVSFFLFLTIVTLCGLLQLHYFWNPWSEYLPVLLVTWVMIMVLLRLLWQNSATFTRLFKYTKFYIILYTTSDTYKQWTFPLFLWRTCSECFCQVKSINTPKYVLEKGPVH